MANTSDYLDRRTVKRQVYKSLIVFCLIIFTVILNQISQRAVSPFINRSSAIFRSLIYFALFISWGLSVRKRVMQKQVCTYLTIISSLMIFWLALRTIKYFFVSEELSLFKYLWYGYYIPSLLILQISLFIALSMGKPEDYKIPKFMYLFYIPTIILISFVLTNDYHELVFKFTGGIVRKTIDYKHNIVFYIIFAWLVVCAAIIILILLFKSKRYRDNKIAWLPFLPLLGSAIYTILYVKWVPIVRIYLNDMTIVNCLLIMAIFESSIHTGLIRSNRYYGRLFYASSIAALIVDKDYNINYKSKIARTLSLDTLRLAKNAPVDLDENTRISNLPITAGYVLWQEDVSEINTVLDELKEARKILSQSNELLKAELELKERQAVLKEKNRLFDRVTRDIDSQLKTLNVLLSEENKNEAELKGKLKWFYIIGAYIKRRSNLVILTLDRDVIYAKEIEYSFRESIEAISESGIEAFFKRECEGNLTSYGGLLIYDLFQEIIELVLSDINSIFINLKILEGDIELKLQLDRANKSKIKDGLRNADKLYELGGSISEEYEDETLHTIIILPRGEELQ